MTLTTSERLTEATLRELAPDGISGLDARYRLAAEVRRLRELIDRLLPLGAIDEKFVRHETVGVLAAEARAIREELGP